VSVVLTSGWHRDHVEEAVGNCWPAMCGASRTRTDGSPCRFARRAVLKDCSTIRATVVQAILDAPVTCDHMLVHNGRHGTSVSAPASHSRMRASFFASVGPSPGRRRLAAAGRG
jgi:hypothetical protein